MPLTSRLLEESKIASFRAGSLPAEGAISSELVLENKFSKVNALVDFLRIVPIDNTFQDLCLAPACNRFRVSGLGFRV